ncbi:hypothetical protein FQR65_LT04437 [Abscondita terminalis]|nr:hypothetical protein FQR65_LT04437 [Abscondita terminalis]
MNFNQSWNSNRGRSRGNRGCGRGRRGGANMHYRGGPVYHRAVPPLLNTPDPYYNVPRFRGTQESFGHLYCQPLNQEPSWPLVRNRPPYSLNARQSYLPATRVQPQLSSRSTSPLPGTEEYMQRNICEKSAFLKRELELEGSCLNNALNNFDLSDGDYQSDNTNNNFCNNTYQKVDGEEEEDKSSQLNDNVPSPRRNKKQRQTSQKIMSVEEIHEKIINHISNLSHGKKMNLVNLPGPSGYDIAIQEITRQKRMELSKALRDICNDKFKQTEDSSQVINSIIPDFDIKIEELPRELVEQLSSTLNENVTERIHNMCIDPELMFQQAAEILNNSLDLEKNVVENDIDKVDFSYPTFSGVDEHGRMDLGLQNIENSNLSMTIDDSMGQSNMLNFANTDQSTPMNFDATQSLNFNMTTPVNYLDTQSCSSSFDMDFSQNATTNTNPIQDSGLFINKSKPDVNIYSPGHVSDNSSFRGISEHPVLDNINPAFDLNMIDMHEPVDILLPPNRDEVNANQSIASDLLSEEAELAACLAQTDPGSTVSKDSESIKETILTTENNDFSAIIQAEDGSLLGINESQHQQILKDSEINPLLKTSPPNSNNNFENSPIQDACNFANVLQSEDRSRKKTEEPLSFEKSRSNTNSPLRSKEKSEISDVKSSDDLKEKANTENISKTRHDSKRKDKKGKSKGKESESQKKVFEDEQQEKRQIDKKSKTKYAEDDISRKSTEKDEFHDRSDRKHWDRYSSGECSKDYADDDLVERRRQDRRQDDKKPKGKYDDDYYKSDKYDRNKCDSYIESYDDSYRKKYGSIDDDKHRRSDPYHYSKYPIDIDEGRNSKRYYQDKLSSYPHRQDYTYHKYDYSMPSDYYQRQDYSYPPEEYHHSKSHRSKYKKHAKKHKRHRDHSSGSNASSSGSEKNSSASLSYKTKYAVKPADICDSPEDSSASRHPKTSLKERIQVLCDTKMLNFNPELISPKIVDDSEQVLNADNLKNGPLVNNIAENIVQTPPCEDMLVDNTPDIAKLTSDEEDLKGPNEIEALECKKYSQRPWKSPGEKKFMMEHLNQNAAPEDDCKIDIELNVIEKGDIVEYRSEEIFDKDLAAAYYEPLQVSQDKNCDKTETNLPDEKQLYKKSEELDQSNVTNSIEVSSTPETKGLHPEIKLEEEPKVEVQVNANIDVLQNNEIQWASTYTQTDLEKEHSPKKSKKDSVKDKARDTSKEKMKSKQNCFTQTAIVSSNAYTQTHKATDILKHKLIQTDVRGDDLKDLQKPETFESIPKSLRRKRCIERMFEIDKEIDKLIKERQIFYNLLSGDGDGEKESEVATSNVSELDEPKQKSVVKERTKNSRETKALNVETNKQKQSTPKQHVAKQPQASGKKISEASSEPNEHNLQEDSKTKSKLKRGRPKRTQDTPVMEMQKIEEISPESNKKAHIKEESVKESTKPKSSSKESSRKRKNREKGPEEHSKPTKVDMSPSKRHKSEAHPIEKETKSVVEKPIEIKVVETETSETITVASPTKSRKKDKKQEIEKKIESVDDVNVIEKVAEVSVIEPESTCSSEVVTAPTEEENTDSKLNGNTTSEVQIPPPIVELPVIKEPTTSVVPEISSYMKKKKRRLSGILDYRKKKKKSKNKNKKPVPVISSEMFSVKSAVNVTRFSLTQLEEMREEIRSKKIGNESDLCESNADLPHITYGVDSTDLVDTNVVMNENENSKESKMEVEDRDALSESNAYKPQDNVIEFKNFNGAILVIKVVDSTVLAASDKGQLLYFDIDNGALIGTIDLSQTAVTSLVVAKTDEENLIYAGSLDTRLTFVNFDSKSIIKQETLTEPIQCMECSWGFIFVGSDRGSIIRFDLSLDKIADSVKVSNSNILTIKAYQEGPRKVLIVAMRNSPVCVRDALSGLLLRTMQTSFLPTVYTLLIDKNLIYCGTSQHDILVYTFEDGKLVFQHEATKSKGVVCMQIVGNLLLAGCYNGNIYVYNITNNGYLGTMNGPGGLMLSMEIVKNKVSTFFLAHTL